MRCVTLSWHPSRVSFHSGVLVRALCCGDASLGHFLPTLLVLFILVGTLPPVNEAPHRQSAVTFSLIINLTIDQGLGRSWLRL